ncbi:MAG TPA: GNAT family N-acetyltransferase, partial [Candidatus Paceibacterota bacterium]|nr:GNAT family N-acetyltransferase [Candidatus Paceibacterota bacterium]
GSFYTVCFDQDPVQLQKSAEELGKKHTLIETCFSLSQPAFSGRHINSTLLIPQSFKPEDRMELYPKESVKRQVKQARKAPLSLALHTGQIPPEWYSLHVETRARLQSVPHPPRYFTALADSFGQSLHAVLALDGSKIAASALFIVHDDYAHLIDNISLPSYWPMRANNLVYDEMIRISIEKKVRFLDFGLTGSRDVTHLEFKRGFGGTPFFMAERTFGGPLQRAVGFGRRIARGLERRLKKRIN